MRFKMTKTGRVNMQGRTPRERLRQKHAVSAYNSAAGFTLVEVLVAAVIAAMLMSLALGFTFGMRRSVAFARERDEVLEAARVALDQMSRDLACTQWSHTGESKLRFSGERSRRASAGDDRMDFVTSRVVGTARGEVAGGLAEVGYRVNHERGVLLRREQVMPDDEFTSGGTSVVMAENVTGLRCEYFNGKEWVEEWDGESEKDLPLGVKVKLTVYAGGREEQQEFSTIVSLPLGGKRPGV